jgi:hypothetical protein
MLVRRAAADYLLRGRVTGCADYPRARLDDAGLLPGDLFDGMAEEIFVIEINLSDYGDLRLDYVGGVEAATHAHFEYGDVHVLLGEIGEGDGGDTFKKRGMRGQRAAGQQLLDDVVEAREGGGEIGVGDFTVADFNALVDAQQMRRGVKASG